MFGIFTVPRKMEDLALFARHISGSMSARVPLPDILLAYTKDCEYSKLSEAVEAMIPRIESGVALSEAMSEHPKVFPDTVCRLVWLGEQGHTLGETMDGLASTLEENLKSYEQTRRAAIYPFLVCFLFFLILSAIHVFIYPKFLSMFDSMQASVPYFELFGISISLEFVLTGLNLLMLLPLLLLLSAMLGLKTKSLGTGRFLLQMPLIGPVMRLGETARFARHLALLIRNHIPMTDALGLIAEGSPTPYVRAAVEDFQRRYAAGEKLGDLLSKQPLFPASMAVMIASAEDQGGLALTLAKLADYYHERSRHALVVVREVFEPLLLLMVGLFIAVALVLCYTPLFTIGQAVR